jgi:hypothetical protein
MTPISQPGLHIANVVARALIPVFGILILGWSGGKVLLVYLKLVKARSGLLFARWVGMLLVGMLAAPLPRDIYLVLVVLAYAAGTVALELAPEHVLIAMNAQDLLDALTPRYVDRR